MSNAKLVLILVVIFMVGCAALQPQAKPDYIVEMAGMEFVFVKGGTFQMGSLGRRDEQPVHAVTVEDLLVGMYEVTFAQYDQYCKTVSACELPPDEGWGRGKRPVVNVSWHDAKAYAAWLSEQTGQTFRLPSEAEWEYFARAGTTSKYWSGDVLPNKYANCRDCDKKRSESSLNVGSFPANPWRLYDTTGNVREWVLDDYQKNYNDAPVDGTHVSLPESGGKVLRGGSWRDNKQDVTSTSREYYPATSSGPYNGFRLVLQPDASTAVFLAK